MDTTKLKYLVKVYLKKRIVPFSLLLIGILLWVYQNNERASLGNEIPGYIGWIRLWSSLLIILAPYIFLLKEKRYILANLIVFAPIVIIVEMVCFYSLGSPDRVQKDFSLPVLEPNHIALDLGFPPEANSVIKDRKEVEGHLSFEVEYTIDEFSRRSIPNHLEERDEYALFFGCSIAFGYGLDDTSTLPYYYQNEANVNSYNYAANGWGMSNMLARFQRDDLSEQIKEKNGVGIYIFFWDHLHRSLGTMERYTQWVHPYPYFYLDDGKIIRDKTFKDGRYWTSKFYEYVYNSSIVEYFKIAIPNEFRSNHYDLASEMVAESKREYIDQFGNENFYLVMHPSFDKTDEALYEEFIRFLEDKGIDVIDLRDIVEYGPEYHLIGDAHPNAKMSQIMAKELYKRIEKLKKK